MTKKLAHKAAKATREFTGNKITDKSVKPKSAPDLNLWNVEKIIISPAQELRQVL